MGDMENKRKGLGVTDVEKTGVAAEGCSDVEDGFG